MSELLIYINGQLVPESQAKISVFDSAFNFGDAVFEGIRVYAGRVLALDEHLDRLYESAKAVAINVPLSKAELRAAILDWLRANNLRDNFHFRPIITRGERRPPRVDPRFCAGPANIVFVGGAIAPSKFAGLRVVTASIRRIPPEALDSKIKSGNYLNNVLARLEAIRQSADDALMYDTHGFLAEASASNVFLVRRGELLTPYPKSCLEGITRSTVMQIGQDLGTRVRERDITPAEVYSAEEVFLCGTGAEITPVIQVDGREIGNGQPGALTRVIADCYLEHARSHGVPIYEA
ncbi:MAG TPA: branched-chain-amino-acid transaminase [Anaerolineae bacterium]|nr:branched-chain-amino-acid transaminase [Anaerolineae bacterium]